MTDNPLDDIELRINQIKGLKEKNILEQFILDEIATTLERGKEELSKNPVSGYPNITKRDHDVTELEKSHRRRSLSESDKIYILKLDIDNFGNVNKKYGESKGDEVLKGTNKLLEKSIRATDCVRYPNTFAKAYHIHGEEKEVILFAPDDESACAAGERYRKSIESESEREFGFKVTESIGISKWDIGKESYGEAAKRADRNMQIAKAVYGRNNVVGPNNVPEVSQKELEERIALDNLKKNAEILNMEMVQDGKRYILNPRKEADKHSNPIESAIVLPASLFIHLTGHGGSQGGGVGQ